MPRFLGNVSRFIGSRSQAWRRRQGCDRFLGGAKATVISAMGGRKVMGLRRLAGEEEALFEGKGQVFPCCRMPRKRMAVGSSGMCHSAPVRSDKRMQVAAHARSEQGGKLIGRVREAGCRTHLLHHRGPSSPMKHSITGQPKGRM